MDEQQTQTVEQAMDDMRVARNLLEAAMTALGRAERRVSELAGR